MVSAAQLQAQQQQLRKIGTRLSLQQQQQALRAGLSPAQFIRREEQKIRDKVRAQITTELQTQGKQIDLILKNVSSIEQFNELIKQVPPELREFVKTTESTLMKDLQSRIKQVEDRISKKQGEIPDLISRREFALEDKDRVRADRLEAERRGIEKEIGFLQGTLPQLRAGNLLPIPTVLDVARDVGISEEDKRNLINQELNRLGAKLEGGRQELSKIIRTQQITQTQAIQLGLIPAQIPITPEAPIPIITPTLPPPVELLPGQVTQIPQVQKPFVEEKDIPPEFRGVFQKITTQQILTRDLGGIGGSAGIDFSSGDVFGGTGGIDIVGFGELLPGQVTQVPGIQPPLITEAEARRIEQQKRIKFEAERRLTKEEFEKLSFIEKGFVPGSRLPKEITIKERAGIFTPLVTEEGLGEPVLSAIEKIGSFVTERIPEERVREFLEKPVSPTTREITVDLIDTIIKFGIFSPFLVTGAAAKQKLAKRIKTKQVKRASKKDTEKVAKAIDEAVRRGVLKEKLIQVGKDISGEANIPLRKIKISNFEDLLNQLVKQGSIRAFFIDSQTGQVAILDNQGLLTRTATKFAPEIELQIQAILFEAPQIPKQALVEVGAAVSLIGDKKFQDLIGIGKIPSLEVGKIAGLEELGKFKDLDLEGIKEQQKQQQKNFQKLFEGVLTIPKLEQPQLEFPKFKQPQIPIFKIPTITIPDLTFPGIPGIPEITKPPKVPPKPIPFLIFPDEELRLMKLPKFKEGFDLFIKEKGKRVKRESNISMDNVLDIGSWITDNSISREFSFEETGKKAVKSKLQVPSDYWERNQSKFRNFRIQQGQFKPLKNKFIEKTDFAIDSRGEVQQLSVARFLAQQRKQNKEMEKMTKNLASGFNTSKPQRQPRQQFKQFDITKTINFNSPIKKIKRKRK